jgi:hydrogenase-4 component F
MISVMLLFPVVAAVLLFVIKSRALNIITLLLYSFIYFISSIMLVRKPVNFTPYFALDNLNTIFIIILAILFLGVALYSVDYFEHKVVSKVWHTLYVIFLMLFISAMTGAILSTHLGLLWVFIEATTIVSAPLIYFEKTKFSLEATWKYVFICSIGIALAFVGIILLSIAGVSLDSLFFQDLYSKHQHVSIFWLKLSYIFIVIGFGTKMGLAPVHAWLPDAHSEAPSPISAILSGALLNSAFLAILRVYKLMELTKLGTYAGTLLIVMGVLSLFISAVFIIKVKNYKRMLAYSSIENMGLMAIGIGCGGLGIFAALLHMLGHSLTKACFFLTAGNVLHRYGTKRWDEINGIMKKDPVLAYLLLLSMLSIVGLPPFSTFISELFLFKALFDGQHYILIVFMFILLTIIMFGLGSAVIRMCFGGKFAVGNEQGYKKTGLLGILPQVMFIIILIVVGLYMPDTLYSIINNAWSK